MGSKKFFFVLSLAFSVSVITGSAFALEYPAREIEFIAGFGPGSTIDNIARLTCKVSEKYVGKPLVVVNRAGGGGSRGYAAIATAKPDGYTIGGYAVSAIVQPYLMKGVTFQKKNFRMICELGVSEIGLYVKKGGPFDVNLKELIRKAKEKPDTLRAGIGGSWSPEDFARAVLEEEGGVKAQCIGDERRTARSPISQYSYLQGVWL
jgi:tripartite-type tricarboxylate transporter receptor subunit TctC